MRGFIRIQRRGEWTLKKITEICKAPLLTDEAKRHYILQVIARDHKALPDIMEILANERTTNVELISDLNLELSRIHVYVEDFEPEPAKIKNKTKLPTFDRRFVLDKIAEFYVKYKGVIRHQFNHFNFEGGDK